jgi:competence protein ComFB
MKNLVEQAVREVHGQLLAKHTSFCACSQCADDVVTLVLNQLRPRYTTSVSGWTLTHLELGSDQERADLAIRVLDAMRRVADTPRHPPVGPGRPSH